MKKVEFLTTDEFEREYKRLAKKYRSLPNDLREFKEAYLNNSAIGSDLGGNTRKIRISIKSKGKGKSGGARVITYDIIVNVLYSYVVLVTLYDKQEISTVTNTHIKDILKRNGF